MLELGAGAGLPGFAAAVRGAHALLTDRCPERLELLRHSASANAAAVLAAGGAVEVARLDWREEHTAAAAFDIVAASDAIYDPGALEPLARLLGELLSGSRGGCALLAHEPGRLGAEHLARWSGALARHGVDGGTEVLVEDEGAAAGYCVAVVEHRACS